MNRIDIESRLERSLRNQVKAPRLSRSFDAAVWARIDAPAVRTPASAPASRWLFVLNGIGVGVALLMILVFGTPLLAAVETSISLPRLTLDAGTAKDLMNVVVQVATFGSLGFGLMFTSLGRRVRAELRELF